MDLKDYYKAYYDKNGYQLSKNTYSRIAFIKQFIEEHNEKATVLDIGCGDAHLAQLLSKDAEYFGLDINISKTKTFRAKEWDITEFPYPHKDKFFDVVVCSEVLEHMVDPISILKEANRVLKDDGLLIVSTPNIEWLDIKLYAKQFSVAYRKQKPHTWEHIRHYDFESFCQMFDDSDFLIKKCVGADAQFSQYLANARKVMLEKLFEEQMQVDESGPIQTENLTLVDMLLGECFPLDSHTIMFTCEKYKEPACDTAKLQAI